MVRFRNVVGPRQSIGYAKVLPRFVRQALRGEDVTVFGDGTQVRSFCYIDDVVDGLAAMLDAGGTVGKVFTFGSDEEISIVELAQRAIEVAESRSQIVFLPPSDIDDYRRAGYRNVPDIGRARDELGFSVRWTLNDSLAAVAAAFLGRPIAKPTDLDAVGELLGLQEENYRPEPPKSERPLLQAPKLDEVLEAATPVPEIEDEETPDPLPATLDFDFELGPLPSSAHPSAPSHPIENPPDSEPPLPSGVPSRSCRSSASSHPRLLRFCRRVGDPSCR